MKIKSVYLHNIRSYEDATINFPSGSVLLSGDIGSGKSSVLLALEFALFGLQRGSLSGSSLLRNDASYGKAETEFTIANRQVKIGRTLRRTKGTVTQDTGYIIIDNNKEELSATELKKKVLQLLNYPSELLKKNNLLYRYTVYTPQEEMKQILLEDTETRLNTLRKVFGIDRYQNIIENTERFLVKLREEMREKQGKIADLEEKKSKLKEKKEEEEKITLAIRKIIPQLEKARKNLKEKEEIVKKQKEKLEQLNRIKTAFATKKTQLDSTMEQLSVAGKEIRDAEEKISFLKKETETKIPATVLQDLQEKKLARKKLEKNKNEIEKKIVLLEEKKERAVKLTEDISKLNICPLCKQKVTTEHKKLVTEKTKKEISDMEIKLEFSTKGKEEIEKKLKQVEKEELEIEKKEKLLSIIKIKKENLLERMGTKTRLQEEEKELMERTNKIKNEIKELQEKLDVSKIVEEDYNKIIQLLEKARGEEKTIEIKKAEEQKELQGIVSIRRNLQEEVEYKEKTSASLLYYNRLHNWLSEQFSPLVSSMEKNVMARVHTQFSSLFENWFNMLVETALTARLNEEFTPLVEQQGYELDYAYLSGGERTAAALAYRLALNQVLNSLMSPIKTHDILILDEPTDGFSSHQLDKMRNVLDELKTKQLILVSHEPKIESFVDNIIRFEKQQGKTIVS